jgi:hypothetical protein
MRTIPQELDGWPFSLVLINHLRMKKDDMGNAERSKTGGEQVNFQESLRAGAEEGRRAQEADRVRRLRGRPAPSRARRTRSGRPTGRSRPGSVVVRGGPEADRAGSQKTVWDWDWSTVHLLDSLMRGEKSALKFNAAKEGKRLADTALSNHGSASLTFRAFNEEHPTFPYLLGASTLGGAKLHTDPRAVLPALFRKFDAAPFVAAFEAFYEEAADRACRPFGRAGVPPQGDTGRDDHPRRQAGPDGVPGALPGLPGRDQEGPPHALRQAVRLGAGRGPQQGPRLAAGRVDSDPKTGF